MTPKQTSVADNGGVSEEGRAGTYQHGRGPGSADRGKEATGSAIEAEPSVLAGCAPSPSGQSLHMAPRGTAVRLVLLCSSVYASAACFCDTFSRCTSASKSVSRVEPSSWVVALKITERSKRVGVEGYADTVERCCPRLLD